MIERTKTFIKSAFPASVWIYRRMRGVRQALNIRTPNMEEIFSDIYLNNSWRGSGVGFRQGFDPGAHRRDQAHPTRLAQKASTPNLCSTLPAGILTGCGTLIWEGLST